MLGDVDEAEDIVQEAFLRWHLAHQASVRSPEAWLVSVVTRLSVDRLRRLETERATYPGTWLPEPIATPALAPSGVPDTDHGAELASDLSIALLLLLERLAPEERAAFLLREVFASDYADIAQILGRSADAVRQMVHRARSRVQTDRVRVETAPGEHRRILERFVEALRADDAEGLLSLLAPDVVLAGDGGGRAPTARKPLVGTDHVSRFLLGVARKAGEVHLQWTRLNGGPALVSIKDGAVVSAMTAVVECGCIRALHVMRNPEKLRHVLGPVDLV